MQSLEGNMPGAPKPDQLLPKQQRIAELAKQAPEMAFTSLAHHIDRSWLYDAYLQTRKSAAVGVDGQTAQDFRKDFINNMESLLDRAKSRMWVYMVLACRSTPA